MTRGLLNCKIESNMQFTEDGVSPLQSAASSFAQSRKPESDYDVGVPHVHPAPQISHLRRPSTQRNVDDIQQNPARKEIPSQRKEPTDSQSRQLSMFSWTQDDTRSEDSNSEHGVESPDQQSSGGIQDSRNRMQRERNSQDSVSPLFSVKER